MKRKLLFVAALVASVLGMKAQTWNGVTSDYITNADFEGEYTVPFHPHNNRDISQPDGWTVNPTYTGNEEAWYSAILTNTQDTYSNISGKGITIPAEGRGQQTYAVRCPYDDGALITLSQTLNLPAGVYRISGSFFTNNQNELETGFYFGEYSTDTRVKYTAGNGAWRNLTTNFTSNGKDEVVIGIFFKHTSGNEMVAGVDNIVLEKLSIEASDEPVDVTSLLTNPAVASTAGWTGARINNGEQYTGGTGAPDNTYLDAWNATFDMYQTVALPQGVYRLTAATRASEDLVNGWLYTNVSVNGILQQHCRADVERKGNAVDSNELGRGWNWTVVDNIIVNEEVADVTIGFYSECGNNKWAGADDFKLEFVREVTEDDAPTFEPNIYYIYNEKTGKFLSRGSWSGTRAVLDEYGLPIQVATYNGSEYYTLQDLDNKLYYGDSYWMYADTNGDRLRKYTFNEVEEGTYTITNTDLNQYMYVNVVDGTNDYGVAGNANFTGNDINCTDEAYTYWKFLSAEEYAKIQEEKTAANVAAVAEKVDADNFDSYYVVGEPVILTFVNAGEGWTYAVEPTGTAQGNYGIETFQSTQKITRTVTGVEPGLYNVSVQGFYRGGTSASVAAAYEQGYDFVLSYLDANGATLRLANWAEHANGTNPNNVTEAKTHFDAGNYVKSVVAYVGEDGKLNLTINCPSNLTAGWLILNNVTYTKMEEYSVTVTKAGYATYVTPVALTFGDDEAFIITSTTDNYAHLEDVKEAPANTPVIIKGEGKHTFTVANNVDKTVVDGNLLKVSPGVMSTEDNNLYILANIDDVVGFYAVEKGYTIKENQVYLEPIGEAPIKFIGFDFNDDATAISTVETATDEENAVIYNLAGQRVQNPTKGIYIVNGKKVLVK